MQARGLRRNSALPLRRRLPIGSGGHAGWNGIAQGASGASLSLFVRTSTWWSSASAPRVTSERKRLRMPRNNTAIAAFNDQLLKGGLVAVLQAHYDVTAMRCRRPADRDQPFLQSPPPALRDMTGTVQRPSARPGVAAAKFPESPSADGSRSLEGGIPTTSATRRTLSD